MVVNLADKFVTECQHYYKNSFSLNVPDDWLRQCIEYLLEDGQCNHINECRTLVHKHLIDFDLNEIGTECASRSLFASKEGFIDGVFLFQINVCIDVTQSYYTKIQKLIGDENENVNVDADIVPGATQAERNSMKKGRLLTLFLIDGTHSFKAIEYKPISFLNDEILPGTKIQLKGRMSHSNGVLFIGPENCTILGGNVENFSMPENLVAMLKKELEAKRADHRMPNQREKSSKFEATYPVKIVKKEMKSGQNFKSSYVNSSAIIKSEPIKVEKSSLNMKKTSKFNQLYEDDDDDEILANCDLDSIVKSACSPKVHVNQNTGFNNNYTKRQPSIEIHSSKNYQNGNKKSKIEPMNISDDEDFRLVQSIPLDKASYEKPINKAIVRPIQHIAEEDDDDDDIFNQFIDSGNLVEIEKQPIKIKIDPDMLSLKDLINVSRLESCCCKNISDVDVTSLSSCVHIKKCSIDTLNGKLQQTKMKWHHDCTISDGSIHIETYIGDGPLSEFLGLTCHKAKILYKSEQEELKSNKVSHSKEIFETARKNCETKLKSIKSCVMHLKFDLEKKKFCITKIEGIEN